MNKTRLILTATMLTASMALCAQTVLDHDFGSVGQFETYTVVDQNGDGQTWAYDDLFQTATCERDFDADDWLVTPSLALEEGKTYRLEFAVSIEMEGAERMVVAMGPGTDPAQLRRPLLPSLTVRSTSAQTYEVFFVAPETDRFHIGFRYVTTGDYMSNRIYMHSVKVEQAADRRVPAATDDLVVTPGSKGAPTATVTLTTPTKNVGGSTLTELTVVNICRDGRLVKTFDNPGIGQQLSFEDTDVPTGHHTYSAQACNSLGEGETAEQRVFVGIDVPGPVENLRLRYDHETHTSTLTWDKPTVGANGGYIDSDGITYNVRRLHQSDPMATAVEGMQFEDQVDIDYIMQCQEETVQRYKDMGINVTVLYVIDGEGLMRYYVQAVSAQGRGSETMSNSVVIGQPQQLPYKESFANGNLTHYWRTDVTNARTRWTPMQDSRYCQDADGGMLSFNAVEGNETAMAHTGNISMATATTPVLSFYYFYPYAMTEPLRIMAATDGNDFEQIAAIDLSNEANCGRYVHASVPLTQCVGHELVQIGFEATMRVNVELIYIDNVTIIDQRQYDLTCEIVSAPRTLKVGESRFLTAKVSNIGTDDVGMGQYSVDVYAGGQRVGSSTGAAVGAGQSQTVMVPVQPTIDLGTGDGAGLTLQSQLYAEVVCSLDQAPDNNRSDVQATTVKMPRHPQPTSAQAVAAEGAVELTWSVPAAPRTDDGQVTESFETYDDFQRTNFGEWTLVDLDRLLTWGLGEPWHFPSNSDIQSYMIWNPSEVSNAETGRKGLIDRLWYPRTGQKSLASFGVSVGHADDWLVSPELSGNQQVMSFYAHHMPRAEAPEQFQVYVSTTGVETTSFIALDASPRSTTTTWDKYEYVLPQGTKHFAIRKVTNEDGWVLFIDDITFCPDTLASQAGLMLYGYNVYRNGQRINTALVPTPSFTDNEGRAGDVYRVTAVYNQGESAFSLPATATETGSVATLRTVEAPQPTYNLGGQPQPSQPRGIVVSKGKKRLAQ